MPLSQGARVRRYEVVSLLGAGGMGEVYLARDTELDRLVALKVLPGKDDGDAEQRIRRFLLEARTAISLSHPNLAHVYDVGDESGVRFIAMEYVEGETLRARITRGRMTIEEVLDVATQIASALASAHAAGIVHRDIKPENIMLRPDGYVKVLDFGLAKLTMPTPDPEATAVLATEPGLVVGTMHYMSPEQLRGESVDAHSDIFSLGVVLYELAAGQRPFQGSASGGVIAAILTEDPPPITSAPLELEAIILKALAKRPADRYASARELGSALKQMHRQTGEVASGDTPTQVISQVATIRRARVVPLIAIAAFVIVATVAAWMLVRARRIREARASLPEIERLTEQSRYFDAWDLGTSLREILGNDERLQRALLSVSASITVMSDPPGADVFLERVTDDGETGPRVRIGTTPLRDCLVAKGDYVLTAEKSGFVSKSRSLSLLPVRFAGLALDPKLRPMEWKLQRTADAPARMSLVPGGRYRLSTWSRPTMEAVMLDPFFIDQYEVTNREFAQFVDGGGYRRAELWKVPFVKDGRTLTFEEAMREFHDTTRLPGPRGWRGQKYLAGLDDHPVTGVTWYEAAAYAEYRGKALPTLFQWDKAARDGQSHAGGMVFPWGVVTEGMDVAKRANFRDKGTMPAASLRGGMSAHGVYGMAGNVTEWCRNELDDGYAVTGGAFDEAVYQFGRVASPPGFYSSDNLGFRCVRSLGAQSGSEGGMKISRQLSKPKLSPVGDAEYARLAAAYDYPKMPLRARVVKRTDAEAWTLEVIEFEGEEGERVPAYLYLPKNREQPYQVVHYVPAGDVESGLRTLQASMETRMGPFIRSGRAVFGVMLAGYLGREVSDKASMDRQDFIELIVAKVKDLRRGVDYLESRPDIDRNRIGFYGPSAGGSLGLIVGAVESRYRSIALGGVGFNPQPLDPKTDSVNFAPRIRAPKLMLNGRWDESVPLETESRPLFELFPEPRRLQIYEGSHVPRLEVLIPALNGWFDETMGAVR